FEDRDKVRPFVDALSKKVSPWAILEDLPDMANEAGVDESLAIHLAGAFNAGCLGYLKPAYLANLLSMRSADIVTETFEVGRERKDLPINLEYAQRFFRENHIVGIKQSINSDTLGRNISSI